MEELRAARVQDILILPGCDPLDFLNWRMKWFKLEKPAFSAISLKVTDCCRANLIGLASTQR